MVKKIISATLSILIASAVFFLYFKPINFVSSAEAAGPPDSPPPAPIISPPCTNWNNGVCLEVGTSLYGTSKAEGYISTDPAVFIIKIFTIILGISGGIALLLIMSAGYKIITSKGKPEGIQLGRDKLISAIIGLVFIIFSFVIFQLVVSDILKIPGITK